MGFKGQSIWGTRKWLGCGYSSPNVRLYCPSSRNTAKEKEQRGIGDMTKNEAKEFINWLERKYKGLLKDFQLVRWIHNANLLTWGLNVRNAAVEALPHVVWFQHHQGTVRMQILGPTPMNQNFQGSSNLCFDQVMLLPKQFEISCCHSFTHTAAVYPGLACFRRTHLWIGVQMPLRSLQSRRRTWTSKISNIISHKKMTEAKMDMSTFNRT